jgi:DNA-binding MarR family transcriptional regulator
MSSSASASPGEPEALYRVPAGFEDEWAGSSARATEVVLNLIRVGEQVTSRVDEFIRAHGVPSSSGLMVLEVLRGEGGPLQPSEIAARCFLSRPVVSSVLDTLERRGYLRRIPHVSDRRRTEVHLNPSGTAVLEAVLPGLHRAEAAWISGVLDPEQQAALLQQLAAVSAAVSAPASAED